MIENTVWSLGGNAWNNPNVEPFGLPTLTQYASERGNAVFTAGTPTTHLAKIGLLFPSDYAYGSTDTGCRKNLRSGITYVSNVWSYSGAKCKNNNWLHTGYDYWTISPHSGLVYGGFYVYNEGGVSANLTSEPLGVRPTLYLKSDVKIVRGIGNAENPYQLSL